MKRIAWHRVRWSRYEHLTAVQIAKRLGVGEVSVRRHRPNPGSRGWSKTTPLRVINWNLVADLPHRVVAERFGLSLGSVRKYRRKAGVQPPGPVPDYPELPDRLFDAAGRLRPRPFREIYESVSDYCSGVTQRTVYRYLGKLVAAGKIVRVKPPGTPAAEWGYQKVR